MLDEQRILADVKAKTMPSSWLVLRGKRWCALRYSAFAHGMRNELLKRSPLI
ncbi:MAG TPA: hypothetical protein VH540_15435 [Ktedonobacterales bacterium]|jgi:hypothetical protein